MDEVLRKRGIQTLYHAAAYKHVPLVEDNPVEGLRNNVFGTLATARAAVRHGVTDFVLVSTDKAVRPTSVMGASKRLAEMILQAMAGDGSATRFSIVRFGNVLDSSGSVVPLFRRQILAGGPLTVTHPEVTRFFMSIPEAVQLIIQASAMARGGEVFVLDMGQPMRILDLARRMVELSGFTVLSENDREGDIGIEFCGLRPGEKLHEELIIGNDTQPTEHPRILKAFETFMPWQALDDVLTQLARAVDAGDVTRVLRVVRELSRGDFSDEFPRKAARRSAGSSGPSSR
jgi:FlaA1/EpsC-like NDP-sugar epimerase